MTDDHKLRAGEPPFACAVPDEGPEYPEWIDLAADIRAEDGNHDKGAGALAHALTVRGWTKSSPRSSLLVRLVKGIDAAVTLWLIGGDTDQRYTPTEVATEVHRIAWEQYARLSSKEPTDDR